MAGQLKLSKRASRPPPKLGYMISTTNLPQYKRDFRNKRGNYGLAGEALVSGIPYDRSLELRRTTFTDRVLNESGVIVETVKPWNKIAQHDLDERNSIIKVNNKDYDKHAGPLWHDLHECIPRNILDRIKSDDKSKYLKAQDDFNTIHLMDLITQACQGLNRNRIQSLEEEYNKCFQGETKYATFAVLHEEKHDALVSAGKVISDNEFSVHHRDHTNITFGRMAYPEAYNTSPDDPKFPTSAELRKKLWEASQALEVIENQQNKNQSNQDKRNQQGKGDKRNKQENKPERDDALAVMSAKIAKLEAKAYNKGNQGKRQREENATDSDTKPETVQEKYSSMCWNCDKSGHPYFKCSAEKAVCSKCKTKGHCAKYHDEWKAHTDRYKAEKEERQKTKKGKASSIRVVAEETLEEDIPVAHAGSVRIATSVQEERGALANLVNDLSNSASTFAVRVVEEAPNENVTEADSDLAEPPSHLPAYSEEDHDAFMAEMNAALLDTQDPVVSSAALESKSMDEVDNHDPANSNNKEGKVTDNDSHSYRDDFSDFGSFDEVEENEEGEFVEVKGKKTRAAEKAAEKATKRAASPGVTTRSRSNSHSSNGSKRNGKGKAKPQRKPPAKRDEKLAAGVKYRPTAEASPPDVPSVDTQPSPFMETTYMKWPERQLPVETPEETRERLAADASHFVIDTTNGNGRYKYYACIFKKIELIEFMLSMCNRQPLKGASANLCECARGTEDLWV